MVTIHNPAGTIRRRSRNLAGIIREMRHNPACAVSIERAPEGAAMVRVWFYDGAYCETDFACFEVAAHWCQSRAGMQGARLILAGADCGEISRRRLAPIAGASRWYAPEGASPEISPEVRP